jgi:pimeloyl-ACP methyl ester carboxylesterase
MPRLVEGLPPVGLNNFWYRYAGDDLALVFVHGVLSDSRSCWLHCEANDPSVYWPALISTDPRLPNMSIYMGGYYTAVDSGPYEVSACSAELFHALGRPDEQGRPSVLDARNIVFLCHSTGGIVVRHMLYRERDHFRDKRVGVILIASPSYGSKWADRLGMIVDFYNHSQGAQLKWGNWSLRQLDSDFKNLVYRKMIPDLVGAEACENHFIVHRRFLPDRTVLVTKESAGRYFDDAIMLRNTDHFSSVKPASLRHPAHELLLDFILENFQKARTSEPPSAPLIQPSAQATEHTFARDIAYQPTLYIPPKPEVDPGEVTDDRFFGRKGLLQDLIPNLSNCDSLTIPKSVLL